MKMMYIKCKKYNINKIINLKNVDELGCHTETNTIYMKCGGEEYQLLKLNNEDNAETICTHMFEAYISNSMSTDSFIIDVDDILKEIHSK